MRRNFERWKWNDDAACAWRCSECGASAANAVHQGRDERNAPHPYNLRQATCGPDCALARKTRLQRERREEQRKDVTVPGVMGATAAAVAKRSRSVP